MLIDVCFGLDTWWSIFLAAVGDDFHKLCVHIIHQEVVQVVFWPLSSKDEKTPLVLNEANKSLRETEEADLNTRPSKWVENVFEGGFVYAVY